MPRRIGPDLIRLVTALAIVAAVGCKHKQDDAAPKGRAAGAPTAGKPDPTANVAPANSRIPQAWKSKLEFVSQQLDSQGDTITVPAPKGWQTNDIGALVPPDGSSFGAATQFWATKTCNGSCEAKSAADWEKAVDKMAFADELARTPPPKLLKEDRRPGFRELVAENPNDGTTAILVAWWKDGAERAYLCDVTLAQEAQDLASAFEQACLHTTVEL